MLYKLRTVGTTASLTVPPEIARLVPDNARFAAEMHDDGILFRIVTEPEAEALPAWARRASA